MYQIGSIAATAVADDVTGGAFSFSGFLCSECPGPRRHRRRPTLLLVKTGQIHLSLLFSRLLPACTALPDHTSHQFKTRSRIPSVPARPRKKLDKSMISSPASFSHLAHVVYDEEKRLVTSSGVDSPFLDQELREKDQISEEIRRRRRLSSDSIRFSTASPTFSGLFSQLANSSFDGCEKGLSTENRHRRGEPDARVTSLTELDRMDRSSAMPTPRPQYAGRIQRR
ncbi:hypothetical protein R3P38DRAFT_3423451 [Favolaschia claudopus]|uniref:CRIB domain-containing protein n=1 Tax=Favolaschia claudopus TaxID=2862362 RepID=A0AAW0D7P1_9AGAR